MTINKYQVVNEILIWINNDEECTMDCDACHLSAVCKVITHKRNDLEIALKEVLNGDK